MSLCDKLKISCDIVEGVKSLHEKGIVHLDIKIDNILVDRHKKSISSVITDLGNAYIPTQNTRLRNHGNATRSYSPPEGFIAINEIPFQYHKGFDIYAVGSVLYRIFHEKKPLWMTYLQNYIKKNSPKNCFTIESKNQLISILENRQTWAINKEQESDLIEEVDKVIFEMVTPQYKKRLTAEQAFKKFQILYKRAKTHS